MPYPFIYKGLRKMWNGKKKGYNDPFLATYIRVRGMNRS